VSVAHQLGGTDWKVWGSFRFQPKKKITEQALDVGLLDEATHHFCPNFGCEISGHPAGNPSRRVSGILLSKVPDCEYGGGGDVDHNRSTGVG
jgi:hypothetical protein